MRTVSLAWLDASAKIRLAFAVLSVLPAATSEGFLDALPAPRR